MHTYRANKDFSPKLYVTCRVLKLRFLVFSEGPGGFREVREAGRNHFHLSWYLLVTGVTSYDQKRSAANSRCFFIFPEQIGGYKLGSTA